MSQKCFFFNFFENNSGYDDMGCDDTEASGMLPEALDAEKMIIYQPGTGIPELAKELGEIASDSLYF